MKFERNKNSKKYFLCGLILVVVLTVTVTFITSKANYRMTASISLTEGKVVSSPYDINVIAIYINEGDGNYQELSKDITIPTGYTINKEETYCCKGSNCKKENKDNNAILETIGGVHTFRGISKGDKCFIYLDKDTSTAKTMSELLETHYTGRKTREEGTFNQIIENTTIGVIYEGDDEYGTTYYFAGNPLDNWVEFGGYYWRIIRINGDGSIRLIYQGKTEDEGGNRLEPQKTGEETQIGTSKFNEMYNDNAYVGFMYGTPNSTTYEATHENTNSSNAKIALDNWFENSNIKQSTEYFEKIDINVGFCDDRTPTTSNYLNNGNGGMGSTLTYYGAYIRLFPSGTHSSNMKPIFNCQNTADYFTYNKSIYGNKVLVNPVGLITADEAIYAGILNSKDNYLTTNQTYYTMTSRRYGDNNGFAQVFTISNTGSLGNNRVSNNFGIRPVINLRSDVTFTGNGTQSNPYKVVS
ncbi:MAG: hypothetical protein NC483_02410 [Ruminococcus sp.]|nr:hypothetical protein [Ruminococcus sp.]